MCEIFNLSREVKEGSVGTGKDDFKWQGKSVVSVCGKIALSRF